MDNKALKTGVYYNENIFCDTCEQPIDVDFTLPDYCPDISKIFKCRACARITSKSISGKNVTVDGNVIITLLYCDKDNKLCSYEYCYPFSKIKEMPSECAEATVTAWVKCDYINCRAVSGRKVDIHGAASINIRVFLRKTNNIISDYDGDNVQLKRTVAPATIPMGYREKYLVIEDELSIGNAQAPIANILRCDAAPSVSECKVINDKTVVKGDMALTVLYMAEGIKLPQLLKANIQFSQIVEMPGVTELCKCDVKSELASLEVKPFATLTGECRSFAVNAKLLLKCESYCVNEVAVIEDAFSTRFETLLTKTPLIFERISENINENCHVKKKVDLDESISSVVDIWCEVQSSKVRYESGKLCLSAVLLAGMLICDSEDNVSYFEKPIEFEWSHETQCDSEFSFTPEIEVSSVGFAILSANCLELRADITLTGAVYEKSELSLITDMQILTDKPCCSGKKGGMMICFTGEEECVWDIARRYNASINEIMEINELEGDTFKGQKMILVPIN